MKFMGESKKSLNACFIRLFHPLVRLALKKGLSFGEVSEWLKWVFVAEAQKNFSLPGRKVSISRTSIITGLTRKEVQKMNEVKHDDDVDIRHKMNRARRVIATWMCNEIFLAEDRKPLELDYEEGENSFSNLVRLSSGDMPVRAMLDELVRVGAISWTTDNKLCLVKAGYIPQKDEEQKLRLLGEDVASLIKAVDVNIHAEDPQKQRYHKRVCYDSIPAKYTSEFKKLASTLANETLEKLNVWLEEHDDEKTAEKTKKLGLVIHYFEEDSIE
jgi:hypothetical protein